MSKRITQKIGQAKPGSLPALGLAILLVWLKIGFITQADSQALTISADFINRQAVAPDEKIELRLSRIIRPTEGRLAIFLGQTDLTSLFIHNGTVLTYNPQLLQLPLGNQQIIIYFVAPNDDWQEIARFPLPVTEPAPEPPASAASPISPVSPVSPASVDAAQSKQSSDTAPKPRRFGFDKLDFVPSLTLAMKSQPAQSNFPDSSRPDRPTFTDLTLQGSFRSDLARAMFNSQTQFDIVGSSFRGEALRFGQLGGGAPRIDLSSYLMQFQVARARYLVGHTSFGANRHLINSFSSRGMTLTIPVASRYDLSLAAMNGTTIVGYENFFGLSKRRHQVLSAALGAEFLKERPGGLRFETSLFDGWLQPVSNVGQGNINDAERSRGFGFRILASDPTGRLRLDSGFARSRFISPEDPLLSQGNALVPFPQVTRNARYLDASYDLLKNFPIGKQKQANLALTYRHERVDPLFRSLGASTQADKQSQEFLLVAAIGEVSGQFAHFRFNDNLAGIPSLLKSLTRANRWSLAAEFGSLLKNSSLARWLPGVSYRFDQIHQFGARVPAGGGFEFDLAAIPDQIGTNQNISADWQFEKVRLGYRLNHSLQNNRQPGRESADFINLIHGLSLGITPTASLDLAFDLNIESAGNKELARVDRTFRVGPNINWRMSPSASLSANLTTTLAGDDAGLNRNRSAEADVQWSYRFAVEKDRFRKLQSQFFIRYANRFQRSRDKAQGFNNLTKSQTLNLGLSFTFF
jgi:hypothetical protein